MRTSMICEFDGEQVMDTGCDLTEQRQDDSVGRETDESLIGAIANRDERAMCKLYERHKIRAFRFILRIVGDVQLTEDILTEVFLEVWRQAGKFEMRSQVSTWILAIARFKAWSASRQMRRNTGTDEIEGCRIEDSADGPEAALLKIDRAAQLRRCLAQLSPEHREIIDLVYYHEKTISEIVEIIRVPTNTVKTRLFYARKGLASLLKRHEDFNNLSKSQAA
jgi:RNA polymerase sigma-70 factor, ECF subfamily